MFQMAQLMSMLPSHGPWPGAVWVIVRTWMDEEQAPPTGQSPIEKHCSDILPTILYSTVQFFCFDGDLPLSVQVYTYYHICKFISAVVDRRPSCFDNSLPVSLPPDNYHSERSLGTCCQQCKTSKVSSRACLN